MPGKVINATTEQDGRKTLCHLKPIGFRHPSLGWEYIRDHVTVSRDARSGAYTVAGLGQSVEFRPLNIPPAKLKRTVVSLHHLGDVLTDCEGLDEARYRVSWSGGAVPRKDRLGFELAEGVGLFFDDWVGRFGTERIALHVGKQSIPLPAIVSGAVEMPEQIPGRSVEVSVDLRGVQPDEFGEINLDPSVNPVAAASGYLFAASVTWAGARGAATADGSVGDIKTAAYTTSSSYVIRRSPVVFDTSAVAGRVLSASLSAEITNIDDDDGPAQIVYGPANVGDVLAEADYDVPFEGTPLRSDSLSVGDVSLPLRAGDITVGGVTRLMLRQSQDFDDDAPDLGNVYNAINFEDVVLELEMAAAGGASRIDGGLAGPAFGLVI